MVGFFCACLIFVGCDAPNSPPSGSPATRQSTVTGGDLDYPGPALPGLAARPLARLANVTFGAEAPYVVGNSFAFVTFKGGQDGDPSGSTPGTVTFYDAATGQKTATVDVPLWDLDSPQVGEFGGTPAIFLHGVETTKSDGLNQPTKVEHQVGFDAAGRKITDLTWAADEDRMPMLGWSVSKATGSHVTRTDLVVYAADGSARLTIPPDQGAITETAPELVTIVGDIALVRHVRVNNDGPVHYLVAYDLTHPGSPLWTTEASRPTVATGSDANVAFVSGGKLGLIYPAGAEKVTVAVQDARTGAVAGATPPLETDPTIHTDKPVAEADNAESGAAVLAVTHYGSVAVSLADGHVLWQQASGQEHFRPRVVVGGVVYGGSGSSPELGRGRAARSSLALTVANAQVQAKSLSTAPVAATDQGYAIVPEVGEDTSGEEAGATGSYWIFQARPS